MLEILPGSIVTGKSGKPMKVVSIEGEALVLIAGSERVKARLSAITQVLSQPQQPRERTPAFHVGDLVTLLDKYMVRAADIGTVEAVTGKGVQVLWDNNVETEPNLKQPPVLWRTFQVNELEAIDQTNKTKGEVLNE